VTEDRHFSQRVINVDTHAASLARALITRCTGTVQQHLRLAASDGSRWADMI